MADTQTIISLLKAQISEREAKIKSLRDAIAALRGSSKPAAVAAPVAAPAKKRRRRRKRTTTTVNAKPAATAPTAPKPASLKVVAPKPKAVAAPKKKATAKPKIVKPTLAKPIVTKPPKTQSKATNKPAGESPATGTNTGSEGKQTLEQWLLKQFEDGTPRTARQLLDIYNSTSGKKLGPNGFFANLSIIKRKGNVQSMKHPVNGLAYNGKGEWFENGMLKQDYMDRIPS